MNSHIILFIIIKQLIFFVENLEEPLIYLPHLQIVPQLISMNFHRHYRNVVLGDQLYRYEQNKNSRNVCFCDCRKNCELCEDCYAKKMFVLKVNCAIAWAVYYLSMITYLTKTEAASINQKMLDSREHISTNLSVNITRSFDGDIITVNGKKKILLIESEKKSFVASLASLFFALWKSLHEQLNLKVLFRGIWKKERHLRKCS